MPRTPKITATKILSQRLGLRPTLPTPTKAVQMKRTVPLSLPGSHAALLQKLYGGK